MNELLNTINNIKNNGILTPINIFTKKDENKIIKKILNSDKFKEIYPNTDKEKALSIIKCNFGLLASKEENNNYNHEFLVYDNGGSKEIFLYFEGSRARKWSLENEIIEVQETKTYKDIDNSIVQAATKENKINDLSIDNKIVERANNLIESLEINPGEQAQTYINYLKNKGIDSKDKNNKLVLAARVHLIKYGYFKTDAIAKAAEIEGVKSTKELEQKYFNKLVDILKNGSEEVEPIKEEFYNNNEVEEGKEMQSKEIKELEKKYNVDIKFREFKGKLMYSVFYSPLRNNVTGIFKDIKQLEKQCKSVIIDNRISLTNKINKLENEYLRNI